MTLAKGCGGQCIRRGYTGLTFREQLDIIEIGVLMAPSFRHSLYVYLFISEKRNGRFFLWESVQR